MAMVYVMFFLNVLLLVAGQSLWKVGLERMGGLQLNNILQVLFSPLILAGLVLYGIATILWLAVLSRLPLSVAYPLQSLAYVLGIFVAFYFFHEAIPLNRWIGVGIIVVGVSVLGWK